jgi:hypothetical protein
LDIFENDVHDGRWLEIGEVGLLRDGLCVTSGFLGGKGNGKIGVSGGDARDSAFGEASLLPEGLISRSGR